MANPTRFPSGLAVFGPGSVFNNFPAVPAVGQVISGTEMAPYVPGVTVSTTNNATIASVAFNGGLVDFTNTNITAPKAYVSFTGAGETAGQSIAVVQGNKFWFNVGVGHDPTFLADTGVVSYYGLFDNVDPTAAANGIYFTKPAGGNSVSFVIKNTATTGSAVTTTITGVADLTKPSGVAGDASSVAGTVASGGTGGNYNAFTITTAGSGYLVPPVVRATGATGSGGYLSIDTANGGLYNPVIGAVGRLYTTYTNALSHLVYLGFYYDGKGTLYLAVNNKAVASIGVSGSTPLASGATVAGYGQYAVSTTDNASLLGVTAPAGAFENLAPLVPLADCTGMSSNTSPNDHLYVTGGFFGTEV